MEKDSKNIAKSVFKFIKTHGFVLFVGLISGRILGEESFSKFLGESIRGFWFWVGSYGLGWVVLMLAYIINGLRQKVCGKGKNE
ncbi:MAG TPA: hypothetical protein VMW09_01700 [Desulfatiglandales bacterium]|nr:hypothetical protein [Desulfatiglandales bacterium]